MLVREPVTQLTLTSDILRVQGLEGCISGNAPKGAVPPGGKDGPTLIDEAGVRERYGIEPSQVPDFIALRGDPSDGLVQFSCCWNCSACPKSLLVPG